MIIPPSLQRYLRPLAQEAARRGIAVYAVGGCVRDWMLGGSTKDLDFVADRDTNPLAEFCRARWAAEVEVFDRFGTIRVHTRDGFRLDFVRARAETYAAPAALPVVRPGSLAEDLFRRDFTVNAMARRLTPKGEGELVDLYGGARDLKARRLKVLHDRSFIDDPTRMFRAARFSCRFRFQLDSRTETLRRKAVSAKTAALLSRERIRGELLRVLQEKEPNCALKKLKSWNLSRLFHSAFVWPEEIADVADPNERLGLIALHMDDGVGSEFIRSLNIDRKLSQPILEALEVAKETAAPRSRLDPLAARILELYFSDLPRAAFQSLMINGRDLQSLGLKEGPHFKTLLLRAARAQWRGAFSRRSGALRWLRDHVAAADSSKSR